MQPVVLDSWAVLAYLHKERAHEQVKKLFKSGFEKKLKLYISTVNFAEVYYKEIRLLGKDNARKAISMVRKLSFTLVSANDDLVMSAAEVKADYPIAIGDCFVVATAIEKDAVIATGDPEFKKIEELVEVDWLK
jgi:uncharacterized protein